MNAEQILSTIQQELEDRKNKRVEYISVDNFLEHLNELRNDASDKDENDSQQAKELAEDSAANDRNIAHYSAQQQRNARMFDASITFASAALKSAILINGGAAIALLAFIGNIWSDNLLSSETKPLTDAIFHFGRGVLFAAITTVATYFTQFFYSQGHKNIVVLRTGYATHATAIGLMVFSYVEFARGISAVSAALYPNSASFLFFY